MAGMAKTRKRIVNASAAVLVVCLVAVAVLTRNTRTSAGGLVHDDTVRSTTVEKTWHERIGHGGPCLTIDFRSEITGNARRTWGLTGPATVWEHLRVHNTRVRVRVFELSDGECGAPAVMQHVSVFLSEQIDDGWRHLPDADMSFGKGASATGVANGYVGTLDGDAYGRGDAYRTTVAMYVEPHWRRNGGTASDGVQVEAAVELPSG